MQDLQRQQASVSRLKRFQALIRQELKTLKAKIEKDREAERAKVSIAAQS
jgi:AmiR/NasT family two-component response regulator